MTGNNHPPSASQASSRAERVLILGGGLAGLSAAEALVDSGLQVTVVDAFPVPGGRVSSFQLPVDVAGLKAGDVVEHGLHAFFQHYHELLALMDRAGLPKPAFSGRGVHLWDPELMHVAIEGGPGAWLVRALGLPESLRGPRGELLSAFVRLIKELPRCLAAPEETDSESAMGFLQRMGVPQPAIERVFASCMYSLTSLRMDELSALEMMRWMSRLIPDPRMRALPGGSTQTMCAPIAEYLAGRGVDLRFGVEVLKIGLDDQGRCQLELAEAPDRTGVRHLLVEGYKPPPVPDAGAYDAVICTLPWERLLALSDASVARFAPELIDKLKRLHNIHPLSVRLWFERPIDGAEAAYILARDTLFDVVRPTPIGPDQDLHLLDLLVENIERELPELGYDGERFLTKGTAADAVVDRLLADLERLYPGQIKGNPVMRMFFHTREGIVACRPGVWSDRPGAHVGSDTFVIAGDYTQQPYGVCMEGAVRSGQLAAATLLQGRPQSADLKPFSQVAYSMVSLFQRS